MDYIRSLARPFPEDYFDFDFVGAVDVDEVRSYLVDHDVIYDTENGIQVDNEKATELGGRAGRERYWVSSISEFPTQSPLRKRRTLGAARISSCTR